MEYPNDEVVTLLIPFSKKEVLMDFLGARELISVTHDDIYVINELLICLEITVGDTTIPREESTGNTNRKENHSDVGPNVSLDVVQSFLMIHGRNIDNLNISMIVKISLNAQGNKIETQNISLKSKISDFILGCTIFSKCSQIKPTFLHSMCIGEIRSHAKFQVSSFNDLAWPPLFVNQS